MLDTVIANNLKLLRKSMGWSLDTAALKTSVSKSMLGQIEREESSPTIGTLWKIANGFQVPLSKLLEEKSISASLGSQHWQSDKGLEINPLFHFDPISKCEIFILQLSPGYKFISPPHACGVLEHVIVIEGSLEILCHSNWTTIQAGEGIRFSADVEHGYCNSTNNIAVFHNVIHYAL